MAMTPSSLSLEELDDLNVWRLSCAVHYNVGVPLPHHLSEAVPAALKALVAASAIGDIVYVSDGTDAGRTSALKYLETQRLAKCTSHSALFDGSDAAADHEMDTGPRAKTTWTLTALGRERLQPSWVLENPRSLSEFAANPLSDMSEYELLAWMRKRGWSGQVFRGKRGRPRRAKSAAQIQGDARQAEEWRPAPYTVGNIKTWWVRPSDNVILREALSLAETHQQPVEPFRPKHWYLAILAGKDPSQARVRQIVTAGSLSFAFEIAGGEDTSMPQRPTKRQRRTRRSKAVMAALIDDMVPFDHGAESNAASASDDEADGDSRAEEFPATPVRQSAGSSDGSSRSGSSGCSSDSSSSSSSSRSSSLASAASDAGLATARGSAEGPPGSGRGRVAETTIWWHGFKITERYSREQVHIGWEATCCDGRHGVGNVPGARCKRTGQRGSACRRPYVV